MTPWYEEQRLRLEVVKDCRSVLGLTSIPLDLLWEHLPPPTVLLLPLRQGQISTANMFLEAGNFN